VTATDLNDIADAAAARNIRLEDFAAELTTAVYPLVLRCRPSGSWLEVELDLWNVLTKTVKTWFRRRPAAVSARELDAWSEGFLADVTESAFYIAAKNGIEGSLHDLKLALCRAVLVKVSTGNPAGD